MPAIDYDTIKGRIAKTTGTLSALNVAIGSYCVVLGYQNGMYADGTVSLSGDGPLRPGGSKCMKVVFYATRDEAWAESGFVCNGEPAAGKEQAVARRSSSIMKKVLQLTAGQMGRLGVGAVEGERNSIVVPQPVEVATADAGLDADAEAALNMIARTKPLLTGSVLGAFSMVIGDSTRFLWHATVTADVDGVVTLALREMSTGPVVKVIKIPQAAAVSQFGFVFPTPDPFDFNVQVSSDAGAAILKWAGCIERAITWDGKVALRPMIELGAALGVVPLDGIPGPAILGSAQWTDVTKLEFAKHHLGNIEPALESSLLSFEAMFDRARAIDRQLNPDRNSAIPTAELPPNLVSVKAVAMAIRAMNPRTGPRFDDPVGRRVTFDMTRNLITPVPFRLDTDRTAGPVRPAVAGQIGSAGDVQDAAGVTNTGFPPGTAAGSHLFELAMERTNGNVMDLYKPFPHAEAFAYAAKDMGELDAFLRSSTVLTIEADALRSQVFRGPQPDVHLTALAALESFLAPSDGTGWSVDTLRSVLGGDGVKEGLWKTPSGGHDSSRLMSALTGLATASASRRAPKTNVQH